MNLIGRMKGELLALPECLADLAIEFHARCQIIASVSNIDDATLECRVMRIDG